jgi:hypothetical protein
MQFFLHYNQLALTSVLVGILLKWGNLELDKELLLIDQ